MTFVLVWPLFYLTSILKDLPLWKIELKRVGKKRRKSGQFCVAAIFFNCNLFCQAQVHNLLQLQQWVTQKPKKDKTFQLQKEATVLPHKIKAVRAHWKRDIWVRNMKGLPPPREKDLGLER